MLVFIANKLVQNDNNGQNVLKHMFVAKVISDEMNSMIKIKFIYAFINLRIKQECSTCFAVKILYKNKGGLMLSLRD